METRTNKYGFPVIECDRCGGTGTYAYNPIHGRKCFKCHGNKHFIAPHAKNAWEALQKAVDAITTITAQEVTVGTLLQGTKNGLRSTFRVRQIQENGDTLTFTNGGGAQITMRKDRTLFTVHEGDFDLTPFRAMIPEQN